MAISKRLRTRLAEAQNHRCAYCGCSMGNPIASLGEEQCSNITMVTSDHIVPKSNGGKDDFGNLVAACYGCNSLRGSMDHNEFYGLILEPQADYRIRNEAYYQKTVEIPAYFNAMNAARNRYNENFKIAA